MSLGCEDMTLFLGSGSVVSSVSLLGREVGNTFIEHLLG